MLDKKAQIGVPLHAFAFSRLLVSAMSLSSPAGETSQGRAIGTTGSTLALASGGLHHHPHHHQPQQLQQQQQQATGNSLTFLAKSTAVQLRQGIRSKKAPIPPKRTSSFRDSTYGEKERTPSSSGEYPEAASGATASVATPTTPAHQQPPGSSTGTTLPLREELNGAGLESSFESGGMQDGLSSNEAGDDNSDECDQTPEMEEGLSNSCSLATFRGNGSGGGRGGGTVLPASSYSKQQQQQRIRKARSHGISSSKKQRDVDKSRDTGRSSVRVAALEVQNVKRAINRYGTLPKGARIGAYLESLRQHGLQPPQEGRSLVRLPCASILDEEYSGSGDMDDGDGQNRSSPGALGVRENSGDSMENAFRRPLCSVMFGSGEAVNDGRYQQHRQPKLSSMMRSSSAGGFQMSAFELGASGLIPKSIPRIYPCLQRQKSDLTHSRHSDSSPEVNSPPDYSGGRNDSFGKPVASPHVTRAAASSKVASASQDCRFQSPSAVASCDASVNTLSNLADLTSTSRDRIQNQQATLESAKCAGGGRGSGMRDRKLSSDSTESTKSGESRDPSSSRSGGVDHSGSTRHALSRRPKERPPSPPKGSAPEYSGSFKQTGSDLSPAASPGDNVGNGLQSPTESSKGSNVESPGHRGNEAGVGSSGQVASSSVGPFRLPPHSKQAVASCLSQSSSKSNSLWNVSDAEKRPGPTSSSGPSGALAAILAGATAPPPAPTSSGSGNLSAPSPTSPKNPASQLVSELFESLKLKANKQHQNKKKQSCSELEIHSTSSVQQTGEAAESSDITTGTTTTTVINGDQKKSGGGVMGICNLKKLWEKDKTKEKDKNSLSSVGSIGDTSDKESAVPAAPSATSQGQDTSGVGLSSVRSGLERILAVSPKVLPKRPDSLKLRKVNTETGKGPGHDASDNVPEVNAIVAAKERLVSHEAFRSSSAQGEVGGTGSGAEKPPSPAEVTVIKPDVVPAADVAAAKSSRGGLLDFTASDGFGSAAKPTVPTKPHLKGARAVLPSQPPAPLVKGKLSSAALAKQASAKAAEDDGIFGSSSSSSSNATSSMSNSDTGFEKDPKTAILEVSRALETTISSLKGSTSLSGSGVGSQVSNTSLIQLVDKVQLFHATCSGYTENVPPHSRFRFRELLSKLTTQMDQVKAVMSSNNSTGNIKVFTDLQNAVKDLVNIVQR